MKLSDFKGKLVFLVGGSSGIGQAIAKRIVKAGGDIILFARNEGNLSETCRKLHGMKLRESQIIEYSPLDIADHDQVDHVMQSQVEQFGIPDVLINCAGRAIPRYTEDIHIDQFDETFRVNLYGCRNTIHALLPHMKKRGGLIVNTSSLAGLIGVFGLTDYSASKFALIGYSEALRSELKQHKIDVKVLCPPDTDTPGFHEENKTKPLETHAVSGTAKLLTSEQVAEAFFKELPRNKLLIVPGKMAKFSHVMKRWFPRIVERMMDRDIRRAG